MPKIKTSRVSYPEGWELIEPTIRELDAKMREGMHRRYFIRGTHYWNQLIFGAYNCTNTLCSCSWKWSTWWEEEVWSSLAHFPYFSSKEPLHIWSLLQKEGDITEALWVLPGPGLCRPQSDSEVEKGRYSWSIFIVYCLLLGWLFRYNRLSSFGGRLGGRDVNLLMFCNQLVDLFSGNDA